MQRFLFCLFSFARVTFRLNFRSLIPPRLFSKRLLDILSIVSRFPEGVGQAISELSRELSINQIALFSHRVILK